MQSILVLLSTFTTEISKVFFIQTFENCKHNWTKTTHFTTGYFPNSLWMLFHVFLPTTSRMSRTHKLRVIFETRWYGFTAMRISFHKLNHLGLFLMFSPSVKCLQRRKYKRITIVVIPWTVRSSWCWCTRSCGGNIRCRNLKLRIWRCHLLLTLQWSEVRRKWVWFYLRTEPEMLKRHLWSVWFAVFPVAGWKMQTGQSIEMGMVNLKGPSRFGFNHDLLAQKFSPQAKSQGAFTTSQ